MRFRPPVCALLLLPAVRAGAVRYRDGRRHRARRVRGGRSRGQGHADRASKPAFRVVKTSSDRRQLRVRRGEAGPLRRDRREERVRGRAGRQRAGPGRRAPARRPADAGRPGHREGRGHGVVSRCVETDSSQRGQVITRRADARPAAHLARVLVAGAADDRRQAWRLVADDRQHAARGGVQRQRAAQHVQQLPDRRRRQQRLRHQQPGLLEPGDAAAAGRHRRVQGRHQQHERRVRPRGRGDDQRQLPQRHQRSCTAPGGSSCATRR